MKRVIVHIGRGKTGSSALQSFLANNQEVLNSKGFAYPKLQPIDDAKIGKITSGNSSNLARSLLPSGHPERPVDFKAIEELANLKAFIDHTEYKNIILSSEYFSHLPKLSLKKLNDFFVAEGVLVSIVCYIREQVQLAQSIYAQQVKRHGETKTADEFCEKYIKNPGSGGLNYAAFLKTYEHVFDSVGLIPVVYSATSEDGVLYSSFLDAAGVHYAQLDEFIIPKSRINPTPSLTGIEFLVRLNRAGCSSKGVYNIYNLLSEQVMYSAATHQFLSLAVSKKIQELYNPINQSVFDKYFKANGRDLFYPDKKALVLNGKDEVSSILDAVTNIIVEHYQ